MILYPHQEDALSRMSNGCVLWGGVGSGKTATALAYYIDNESPKDLYVITTAKKRDSLDWEAEAAKFTIGRNDGATAHGKITVDSWNNIAKYKDVLDAFFIFDEQRLVGSGAWVQSFLKLARKNNWILLSATPGDSWLDYIPVFVANGLYKNRTEFKREHVVYSSWSKFPKVERILGTRKLLAHRASILVEMPYERHTTREVDYVDLEFDCEAMDRVWKRRWHVYEERPLKDVAEMFRVARRVVNEDPAKIEFIRALLKERPKVVVFYNFNYELDILRTLANITTVAEWNGHQHDELPTTDSWIYLVQYASGAEGWNCVETDTMVFYSPTYSYRQFEQAQGRIDRMNTPFDVLYYYVLVTDSIIDKMIKHALKGKKDFNEKRHYPTF